MTVRVGRYGFEDAVGLAFDQIRRSAFTSGQVAVLQRLLEVLDRAISANPPPPRRRSLWARAFAVARLAPDRVSDPRDAANLVLAAVEVGSRLQGSEAWEGVDADLGELLEASGGLPGEARIRAAVAAARADAGPLGASHGHPHGHPRGQQDGVTDP